MLNLDEIGLTISVKYEKKVYELDKIKEREKDFFHRVEESVKESNTEIFGEIIEFIINRFKKADPEFDEEHFRDIVTFEWLVAIVTELNGNLQKKTE